MNAGETKFFPMYMVFKPKLVLNTKQKSSFALKTTNYINFTGNGQ